MFRGVELVKTIFDKTRQSKSFGQCLKNVILIITIMNKFYFSWVN